MHSAVYGNHLQSSLSSTSSWSFLLANIAAKPFWIASINLCTIKGELFSSQRFRNDINNRRIAKGWYCLWEKKFKRFNSAHKVLVLRKSFHNLRGNLQKKWKVTITKIFYLNCDVLQTNYTAIMKYVVISEGVNFKEFAKRLKFTLQNDMQSIKKDLPIHILKRFEEDFFFNGVSSFFCILFYSMKANKKKFNITFILIDGEGKEHQ